MVRRGMAVWGLILVLVCLSSCASPQFSKIDVSMPKEFQTGGGPLSEKIPLRAGLYLSPAIKNYTRKGPIASFVIHVTFPMGDTLSVGSERMLKNIFQSVVLIDQLESDIVKKDIDIIVSPEVVGIDGQVEMIDGKYTPGFQLVMKWNIASVDGKNIYVNTIKGEAPRKLSYSFTAAGIEEDERNNMLLLVKDEFQKAQDDIYSNAWWKKQWWKTSN